MIAQKSYKRKKKHLDKLPKCRYYNGSRYIKNGGDLLIRTDKLRGVIAEKGYSQADIARKIGITPKTFYEKMKIGVFGSDEIQIMIDELHIDNPIEIFFAEG